MNKPDLSQDRTLSLYLKFRFPDDPLNILKKAEKLMDHLVETDGLTYTFSELGLVIDRTGRETEQILFALKASPSVSEYFSKRGIHSIDYSAREDFILVEREVPFKEYN